LMDSVSGVWKPAEGGGLLTVYVSGNQAQASEGDKALSVRLGDVDPGNGTVVLKVTTRGKEELRTLARLESEDGGSDSLQIIGDDGGEHYYSFVRKISNDDLNRMVRLSAAPAAGTKQAAQAVIPGNVGAVDKYIGSVDMNMRSCPGSSCAALIIVPKGSKVSVDTASIHYVTEASGANTPWARVTYEGTYCKPEEKDPAAPCQPSHGTDAPVVGWMNYVRLLDSPHA
jgi:hypothetical protein